MEFRSSVGSFMKKLGLASDAILSALDRSAIRGVGFLERSSESCGAYLANKEVANFAGTEEAFLPCENGCI